MRISILVIRPTIVYGGESVLDHVFWTEANGRVIMTSIRRWHSSYKE